MSITDAEIEELLKLQPKATHASEGGRDYFLLPNLALPAGCEPSIIDALLCVTEESGYKCSLFFAQEIKTPTPKNWNRTNKRILERNWFAYSYQTPDGLNVPQKFIIQYDGITAEKKG
jgi:hypothetical protein